jgi:hypothetical protein
MGGRQERMHSIWFLVGLVLLAMGAVVAAAGVLAPGRVVTPGPARPALWWGLLMCGVGLAFVLGERRHRDG